jgi:thiamine transport system substrate-binding protein
MKSRIRNFTILTASLVVVAALVTISFGGKTAPKDLTLITHDSFVMSSSLIKQFESQSGYHLKLLTAGDAGAMTNRLILTKGAPIADAVFGIDNTLSGEAYANNLIDGKLVATDYGNVCLNYDKLWFIAHHAAPPISINDLTKPQYAGLTVLENPATSSTGLSFLAATVDKFGSKDWQNYWRLLKANKVKVDDGWETAYYTDFSGSSGKGAYPVVLSYGTSPADEVRANGQSQTAAILDGCFKQTEYAGTLRGAHNPQGARALIQFLLNESFQRTFPITMYMYPISTHAAIPASWSNFTERPTRTFGDRLDFNADRANWLRQWTAIFG